MFPACASGHSHSIQATVTPDFGQAGAQVKRYSFANSDSGAKRCALRR